MFRIQGINLRLLRATALLALMSPVTIGLTGCGSGTGAIGAAIGGGGGGGSTVNRTPTAMQVLTPSDGQSGRTPLIINIQFDPAETVTLLSVEYSLKGDVDEEFFPATPALGFPTEILGGQTVPSKSATGEISSYRFDWNSHFDVDSRRSESLPSVDRPASARTLLRVRLRNESTLEDFVQTTREFFLDHSLVKTVAGGGVGDGNDPSVSSMLDPTGITIDEEGNLIISDSGNNRIRKITLLPTDPTNPTRMETMVGNGFFGILTGFKPALATGMHSPVATARTGQNLFTAEVNFIAKNDPDDPDPARQGVVRYLDHETNLVSTAIGNLVGCPADLEIDPDRSLFVSDEGLPSIGRLPGILEFNLVDVDPVSSALELTAAFDGSTLLDDDLDGTPDRGFDTPSGIALAGNRILFVADRGVGRVYALDLTKGEGTRVAGGGSIDPTNPLDAIGEPATDITLVDPRGVSIDVNHLAIVDKAAEIIVVIKRSDGTVANVITDLTQPTGLETFKGFLFVCEASDGSVTASDAGHRITAIANPSEPSVARTINLAAHDTTKLVSQDLPSLVVGSLSFDPDQINIDCTDGGSSTAGDEATIDQAAPTVGQSSNQTTAATEAPLARPEDIVLDRDRHVYYVADTGNSTVSRVDEVHGLMTVVAGSFDPAAPTPTETDQGAKDVKLNRPVGLAIDAGGQTVFVANAYDPANSPGNGGTGGNVLAISLGDPGNEEDNRVRVLVPNQANAASGILEQPKALAFHQFASGDSALFVADAGRLDNVTGSEKPRPGLYRLDPSDATNLEVLDFQQEVLSFSCAGSNTTRMAPFAVRFITDIHPISRPDGSLDLLVAVDIVDNILEGGATQDPTVGFEADCYDGVDADGDGQDCTRPMKVAVLLFPFDSTGNLGQVRSVLYGFKRFILDPVTNCGCDPDRAALPSVIDVDGLVINSISTTPDGRYLFAMDPCAGRVTFVEFGNDFEITNFGTAAGADLTSSNSFDGNAPAETSFNRPRSLAVDDLLNLYLVDTLNNRVRRSWVGDQVRF